MIQPVANSYKQNQIDTAPAEELTLMLYTGGITYIRRAKEAIQNKNVNQGHQLVTRVQDIVDELIITLDRSYPISEQLILLYDYMKRRLIEANIKKDTSILDEIEGYFIEFRDTWKQAMVIARSQKK